jgi:hypothetical protein
MSAYKGEKDVRERLEAMQKATLLNRNDVDHLGGCLRDNQAGSVHAFVGDNEYIANPTSLTPGTTSMRVDLTGYENSIGSVRNAIQHPATPAELRQAQQLMADEKARARVVMGALAMALGAALIFRA